MTPTTIWRDRDLLAAHLAAWWRHVGERELFRVVAGPGWLRLHLVGEERPGLMLTQLPAALLVFPFRSPLPRPLHESLTPTRGEPLVDLLKEGRLAGVALLAEDLVLQLRIVTPAGGRRVRQQLFGSRGGLVVLDDDHRMLYTAFPSPHPALVVPQPALAGATMPAGDLELWSQTGLLRLIRQREITLADGMTRIATRTVRAAERLVENLAADQRRADGGDSRRRDAETLATYLHEVARGQESVTLTDPHDGSAREIALDPALTPQANLERLFKLARKSERGHEVIVERLARAREDLDAATALATALAELTAGPAEPAGDQVDAALARLVRLQEFRARHPEALSERDTTGLQAPDEPTRLFRRYRIDGRWEVWLGRSSEENDLLTHRTSHPRDLWLHAQGVPGSHVILRTDGRPDQVPRTVLERAAALAALHSKARNSALVPVIYTERRYVRKPRRAPAGVAVCLQEKNLFAEPKVARGVEPA